MSEKRSIAEDATQLYVAVRTEDDARKGYPMQNQESNRGRTCDTLSAIIPKLQRIICPKCHGNGYLIVKHPGEPDDYHDCDECDCSGELVKPPS